MVVSACSWMNATLTTRETGADAGVGADIVHTMAAITAACAPTLSSADAMRIRPHDVSCPLITFMGIDPKCK
jgi:hypothetical protein